MFELEPACAAAQDAAPGIMKWLLLIAGWAPVLALLAPLTCAVAAVLPLLHLTTLFQLAKQDEYQTRHQVVRWGNKTGIIRE